MTYISLRWKCCIHIEMHRSFRGLRLLDPQQGLCPWTPPGPLSGPMNPRPQGSRALRASIFCTLRKHFLINGAPSRPLPTGTLEQSYATVSFYYVMQMTQDKHTCPFHSCCLHKMKVRYSLIKLVCITGVIKIETIITD